MKKLVREYKKNGFDVKIFAPEATDVERTVKQMEIKENIIRVLQRSGQTEINFIIK